VLTRLPPRTVCSIVDMVGQMIFLRECSSSVSGTLQPKVYRSGPLLRQIYRSLADEHAILQVLENLNRDANQIWSDHLRWCSTGPRQAEKKDFDGGNRPGR